jgi:glycine betaine/proline transport system permease protein
MASQAQAGFAPDLAAAPASDDAVERFTGANAAYYAERFQRIAAKGIGGVTPNGAAFLAGPGWAAARGLWSNFWVAVAIEVIALIILFRGLLGAGQEAEAASTDWSEAFIGLLLFLGARVAQALLANWSYYHRYRRWRVFQREAAGFSPGFAAAGTALMAAIYGLMVYRFSAPEVADFVADFPADKSVAAMVSQAIDDAIDWMTVNFEAFFDAVVGIIRHILNLLELVFVGTPWPVMAAVILIVAWRVGSWRIAVFTAASLAYLGFLGYWEQSMTTLALVGASTLICVVAGTPIGIWCAKSPRVDAVMKPILDVMQTLPSFVYLVPAIAFFGIGKPPGVLATVIFSIPPMIRLTTLGIVQVPPHVKEAALAFGASPRQLLVKIELPLAIPSIMAGINQTIMMCLSMVVIAALIGAGGLGDHIVRALRHVEAGTGILAGIAIVLCAMILDRIIQASGARRRKR